MTQDEQERIREQQEELARKLAQQEAQRAQEEAESAAEAAASPASQTAVAASPAQGQQPVRKSEDELFRETQGKHVAATKFKVLERVPIFQETGGHATQDDMHDYAERTLSADVDTVADLGPKKKEDVGYNKSVVDYDSIKSDEQAFYFASWLYDDESRMTFFENYARKTGQDTNKLIDEAETLLGTRLFANPTGNAARRKAYGEQLNSLPLFGSIAGARINPNNGNINDVLRAIQLMPDDDARSDALDAVINLTQVEGSPFYGMKLKKSDYNKYIDNGRLTEADYKKTSKGYYTLFMGDDSDDQRYLDEKTFIENEYADDEYLRTWNLYALDSAYRDVLGRNPKDVKPTEPQTEQGTDNKTPGKQDSPGVLNFLGNAWNALTGAGEETETGEEPKAPEFSPSEATPEETEETGGRWIDSLPGRQSLTPEQKADQKARADSRGDYIGAANAAQEPAPTMEEIAQETAPVYGDVDLTSDPLEAALVATMDYRGDTLTQETQTAALDYIHQSPGMEAVFGVLTDTNEGRVFTKDAEGKVRNFVNNEPISYAYRDNYAQLGGALSKYLLKASNGAYPAELAREVVRTAAGIVEDATAAYRSDVDGVFDADLNLYDQYIAGSDEALDALAQLDAYESELRQSALDAQKMAADQITKDEQTRLSEAQNRARNGVATDADWALIDRDAPKLTEAELLGDDSAYREMAQEIDLTWMDITDPGSWIAQQTTEFLKANGLSDDLSKLPAQEYVGVLQSMMKDELMKDARRAYALGYENLGAYYEKNGTGTLEHIQLRAQKQLTMDDDAIGADGLEAAQEMAYTGEGVGFGAAIAAGAEQGVVGAAGEITKAIYNICAASDIKNDALQVQAAYNNDYGEIMGPVLYRKYMLQMVESGNIPDKALADYIVQYFESGANPYGLGIMPNEFGAVEGLVQPAAVTIRNREEATVKWAQENATPEEGMAFEVSAASTENMSYMLLSQVGSLMMSPMLTTSVMSAKAMGVGVSKVLPKVANFGTSMAAYGAPSYNEGFGKALENGHGLRGAHFMGTMNAASQSLANMETDQTIAGHVGRALGLNTATKLAAKELGTAGTTKLFSALSKASAFGAKAGGKMVVDELLHDNPLEMLYSAGFAGAAEYILRHTDDLQTLPSVSTLIGAAASGLASIDLKETIDETFSNLGMKALTLAPMAILTAGAATAGEWKSYKAIMNAAKTGSAKDGAAALAASAEDMKDPQKAEAVDNAVKDVKKAEQTMVNLVSNEAIAEQVDKAGKAGEQAESHKQGADASQAAQGVADAAMTEGMEKMANGDTSPQTIQSVNDAATAYAKNKTGYDEHVREYEQKKKEQSELMASAVAAASAQANVDVRAQRASLVQRIAGDTQSLIAAKEIELRDAESAFNDFMGQYETLGMEGFDEETADALGQRLSDIENELNALRNPQPTVDREAVDAQVQEMEAKLAQQEAKNAAQTEKFYQDEAVRAELDEMAGVYRTLKKTEVYVDDTQVANILSMSGAKSIREFNNYYGTRLRRSRQSQKKGSQNHTYTPLDGGYWIDLAAESNGRLNAEEAHPEEALVSLLQRREELNQTLANADPDMQASVGEAGAERYLREGTTRGNKESVMSRLAGALYKKTGVELIQTTLSDGVRGMYDRKTGKLFISNKLGLGEKVRQVVMHELTHFIEKSSGYKAYVDSALKAAYKGDENAMQADADEIQARYSEAMGRKLTPAELDAELVAHATEKLLSAAGAMSKLKMGSENLIYDLLGEKQSFVVRAMMMTDRFLTSRGAKKEGSQAYSDYKDVRTAVDNLKAALRDADKWKSGQGGADPIIDMDARQRQTGNMPREEMDGEQTGMQFSIDYDQNNRPFVTIEEDILAGVEQKDWAKTARSVMKERFPDGFVVGNRKIQLTGKARKELTNSKYPEWLRLNDEGMYADRLRSLGNADEIMKASRDYVGEAPDHERNDDLVEFARGTVNMEIGGNAYKAEVVVGTRNNGELVLHDIVNLDDTQINKKEAATSGAKPFGSATPAENAAASSDPRIPQADAVVNPYPTPSGEEYSLALNQFGNEHAQRLDTLTQQTKDVLAGSSHEVHINRQSVAKANAQIEQNGIEEMAARLMSKPIEEWNAEDLTLGSVLAVRATDEGLVTTATIMAQYLDRGFSRAGQNLQAATIISRLTPAGALAESAKKANTANLKKGVRPGDLPMGRGTPAKRRKDRSAPTDATAQSATDQNTAAPPTGEFDPDNPFNKGETAIFDEGDVESVRGKAGDAVQGTFLDNTPKVLENVYTAAQSVQSQIDKLPSDVSRDNPWGIALDERQMGVIREYGLMNQELPGDTYSTATLKQRMLAAIVASDLSSGDAVLALCQQLEAMKAGLAVVTEADLNYIAGEMSTFLYALKEAGEDVNAALDSIRDQEARTALARVYAAQANISQASGWEKFKSFGYANMLSSIKTITKNTGSNWLINPLEHMSERIGGVADTIVSEKTGTRTTAAPTRAEMKEARSAARQEIINTAVDHFARQVSTRGHNRMDQSQSGRVYQTEWLETYRTMVNFAMEVGDRPFFERCFSEEMAVIDRLGMKIADPETGEMRAMTQEEMEGEAATRAFERVFQEDNAVVRAINGLRNIHPMADFLLTSILPFTKTPTNAAVRMMQYTPFGFASSLVKAGVANKTGNWSNFDQRAFAMGVGRGLTGSALMAAGWALATVGTVRFGRGEEENDKMAGVRKAKGEPYSMYLKLGEREYELAFALPAAGPIAIGAEIYQRLKEAGEDAGVGDKLAAIGLATLAGSGDLLFDNSMLSGIQNLFRGYEDAEGVFSNMAENVMENQSSRLTPSIIRALAKATDPYVRDTSSQSAIRQAVNELIIQNWPLLRQTLPIATDITGDQTLQSGYYNWGKDTQNALMHMMDTMVLPYTTISEKNDAALDELIDLSYSLDETSFLPSQLVKKYELTVSEEMAQGLRIGRVKGKYESVTISLTDEERRQINNDYANLVFNGEAMGMKLRTSGLRDLFESTKYQRMTAKQKKEAIEDVRETAKETVIKSFVNAKKKAGEIL